MRYLLLLLLTISAVPAGAAPAAPPTARGLVYVLLNDGRAYGYRVQPNGALAPLPIPPVQVKPTVRTPLPDYPNQPPDTYNQQGWWATADPTDSLLYVTGYHASVNMYPASAGINSGQAWGALQVYCVPQSGRLSPVYKKPWSSHNALGSVTIDPKGRFVWVSGEEYFPKNQYRVVGLLFVFRHGHGGRLCKTGETADIGTFRSILETGGTDDSGLLISDNGKFGYAYNTTGFIDWSWYTAAAYRVSPHGRLRFLGKDDSHQENATLMSGTLEQVHQTLYVASDFYSENDAVETRGISVYPLLQGRIKSSRLLVPYPRKDQDWHPITILADPSGRFLYASDNTGVQIYTIQTDGSLVLRFQSPGLDLKAVSRDGHVLYALTTLGDKSASRTALVPARVNPDGSLNRLMPVLLPTDGSVRQILVF